ncbi:hypothetical protein cand_032830 [Cryptosporidium andersoni]|uniref:Protein HGH1 homolog n=1 Tax=Cryptosporidium andersoni TaxID=117008 RepID=A0A1J4MBI1_9CRYT|nr:hypothetical protein cand_032830 [Cryptosporidium andersoni]
MNVELSLDTTKVFDELFKLLRHNQIEVIAGSIELLLDQSETSTLISYISKYPKSLRSLLLLIGNDEEILSTNAIKTLINLSQNPNISEELCSNLSAIEYTMDNLREQMRRSTGTPYHCDLNLMLISNLTRSSKGREFFLKKTPKNESLYLPYLLELLYGSNNKEEQEMIINIFNNCTSCEQGRKLITESSIGIEIVNVLSGIFLKMVQKKESCKTIVGIFTHLCIDRECHEFLMKDDCKVIKILCCILYPSRNNKLRYNKSESALSLLENKILHFQSADKYEVQDLSYLSCEVNDNSSKGKEIIDETYELELNEKKIHFFIEENSVGPVNSDTSQNIFDCILVLLSTAKVREYLRSLGLYEILRVWHLYEQDQSIKKGIEDMVHLVVYNEQELAQQDYDIKNSVSII